MQLLLPDLKWPDHQHLTREIEASLRSKVTTAWQDGTILQDAGLHTYTWVCSDLWPACTCSLCRQPCSQPRSCHSVTVYSEHLRIYTHLSKGFFYFWCFYLSFFGSNVSQGSLCNLWKFLLRTAEIIEVLITKHCAWRNVIQSAVYTGMLNCHMLCNIE